MKNNLALLFFLVLLSCGKVKEAPFKESGVKTTDFNKISEQFLELAKNNEDTKHIQNKLANASLKDLSTVLATDEQRFAFWINVYNAYIQVILQEHPEYYTNRKAFFSKEQIRIAGEDISFSKIEHGIIRKSQWDKGFGYFGTWFPDKFEKKLRVKKRDYRIHFALNCGAKDCPPVAVYTPKRIKEQLDKGTKMFLEKNSDYDIDKNEVRVTSLFNWFRGDFGGEKDIKKILKKLNIIKSTKGVDLVYKDYDWTLELDNFINL